MSNGKVALGAVTKGFNLKTQIKAYLSQQDRPVLDVGCYNSEKFVEYTSIGESLAYALYTGDAELGIFVCNFGTSSAVGVSKFQGVRAVSCESVITAEAARKVNNANVLCLGASVIDADDAFQIVDVFLKTEFLDIPNMPPKLRDFREKASLQVLTWGEQPTLSRN